MSVDNVSQELYDILESLFDKANKLSKSRLNKEKNLEQAEQKNDNNKTDTKERSKEKEQKVSLSELSFKELSSAKSKLNDLRSEINQNPRKYKQELLKLDKAENKIDSALDKRKQKDLNKAITTLKKNPRRYVLKVVETKNKLDTLRIHLEKHPRQNKSELSRINQLEGKLNSKIENMKSKQLNKAIYVIQKNPKRYGKELGKFQDIEKKLNSQKAKNEKDIKEKQNVKTKEKSKENSLELTM
ncbi:hypothetical protein LG329_19570 (plasmid) [Virgibacillus necropolis]|uniref:hypothetical protein n=1 Tax=Virgibacillus necropolis TaxID=163877 RepID=UPI00384E54A5